MSNSQVAAGPPSPPKDDAPLLDGSKRAEKRWLVLIEVSFYMNGTHRLNECDSLSGPTNDIKSVGDFFKLHLGVDNKHTLRLKSTCQSNPLARINPDEMAKIPPNEPVERNKAEWPTYENMLRVLRAVTEKATPSNLVYVYYSGCQAATIHPRKGERGVDEGLVPLDINCGGRYLRDFEIASIVHKMVNSKQLQVTLLFDSCHSGGASRSLGSKSAVPRGVGTLDVTSLPSDISDISDEHVDCAFQAGALQPSLFLDSFWLKPQGYVMIAACLPSQLAFEMEFSGVERGVFPFWLIDSLKHAAEEQIIGKLTHDMLHRRVMANVVDWAKHQSNKNINQVPVLMGNSKRFFTSSTISKNVHSFPLLDTD